MQFPSRLRNVLLATLVCGPCSLTFAQDAPAVAAPAAAQPSPGRPGGKGPPAPSSAAPANGAKPGETPAKPGETPAKPAETSAPAGPPAVVRPAKPKAPANPDELKVRPDENRQLRFNFKGQPWLDVLEWLADISGMSLDWQEVPGDYLNLVTQRSYTVPEARDLINRHLLDRGYTLLRNGEVLTVANIKKLDPSLVPRVTPEELDERDPHEFVKVSFELDWLLADTALEELKPMLSPNGKLTALKATNRLEALDAVVNLQEIYKLLKEEQSGHGQDRLVREFKLQHTRAAEVSDLLHALLGIEKKPASSGPKTPEQMQMEQQQMMMQAQMRQAQGGQPPQPQKGANSDVHLVVNPRENSVLAHAPPDKMAVIEQAVKTLDVASPREQSLLQNMNRMQVYRLAAIDPEPLIKVLEDVGNLDPTTRLQVDKKNKSIVAYASLADHVTIRSLISKLDGSDRRFEVIRLRRLEADYVAGTIEFMMGGGEKKKNENRRSSYYYYDYNPWGGSQRGSEDDSRKFKVDADVEHNRLLVWANEVELKEVEALLVKLGELPPQGGNTNTVRILDSLAPEEAAELLNRLQRAWPAIGPNPLKLVPPPEPGAAPRSGESDEVSPPRAAPSRVAPPRDTPTDGKTTGGRPRDSSRRDAGQPSAAVDPPPPGRILAQQDRPAQQLLRLIQLRQDEAEPAGKQPDAAAEPEIKTEEAAVPPAEPADAAGPETEAPPPIVNPKASRGAPRSAPPVGITYGPDGRLILSSQDTQALDLLEELVADLAPPRKDYKVFHLKNRNTWAYGVVLNLEDFFDTKNQEKNNSSRFNPWWGYSGSSSDDDSARRLSKRRPLKFIADSDSHTILVTGADPAQLKLIEELIETYDRPESTDSRSVRQTKIFAVRYSKAEVIATALKDVYRDLLSVNDRALADNNQKQQKPPETNFTYIYGGMNDEKGNQPENPIKFKGLLSIGVDDYSNTLVVSAAEGLLENVAQTIQALDEAAKPLSPASSAVQVIKLDGRMDHALLQQKLSKLFQKPPAQRPNNQPNQQQQPQQPNQSAAEKAAIGYANE